jgi:hypothetical protein
MGALDVVRCQNPHVSKCCRRPRDDNDEPVPSVRLEDLLTHVALTRAIGLTETGRHLQGVGNSECDHAKGETPSYCSIPAFRSPSMTKSKSLGFL